MLDLFDNLYIVLAILMLIVVVLSIWDGNVGALVAAGLSGVCCIIAIMIRKGFSR